MEWKLRYVHYPKIINEPDLTSNPLNLTGPYCKLRLLNLALLLILQPDLTITYNRLFMLQPFQNLTNGLGGAKTMGTNAHASKFTQSGYKTGNSTLPPKPHFNFQNGHNLKKSLL